LCIHYLYDLTFDAIFFGCGTNCLPFAFPFALAALVAAFSPGDSAFHAASGKYLFLPLEGLPSLVLHFCAVQFLRDCWDLASAIISFLF
jgi:hypothetical protein